MAQEHLWPSGSGPTGCQGQRVGAAAWFWMRISLGPHKPNPPSLTDLRPSFSVLRWKNVSFVAPFWEVASFKRNEPPPFKRMFVSSAATGGGECGWRSHTTGCLWSLREPHRMTGKLFEVFHRQNMKECNVKRCFSGNYIGLISKALRCFVRFL